MQSTVTMSTNSSALVFREDAKAGGSLSVVASSNADETSVTSELPDTELCREPMSYVSPFTLSILWHVVYWTSQALTWFAVCLFFVIILIVR